MQITTLPNPVLRRKAKALAKIDGEVRKLVSRMKQFFQNGARGKMLGVGLAAPQVGQSLKIILVWSKHSHQILTMINPEILWHSKRSRLGVPETKNPYEGCLSIPGYFGLVRRSNKVKVKYLTPKNQIVIRRFSGFTGVIVQHEVDHLEGTLFIDHIKEQKGKLYKLEKEKEGKERLVEYPQK